MNFHFYAFVILFISFRVHGTDDIPTFCKSENISISTCNQNQSQISVSRLPKEIEEYGFINQQIQVNFKISELTKFSLIELNQSLLKNNGKDSRVETLFTKFNLIAQLTAELKAAQSKYDICFKNCSRTRLEEISDDIKKMQKARTAILMSEPLLISDQFEDIISDIRSENLQDMPIVKRESFQKALGETLVQSIKKLNDKRDEYLDYLKNLQNNTIHDKSQDDYLKKHPMILKEVLFAQSLKYKELDPNQIKIICEKYRELKLEEKKEKIVSFAVDAALFVLPFLAGPLFPLAEEGMLIRYIPKLARFGMSRDSIILKDLEIASGLGADLAGLGKSAGEHVTYSKNCKRDELAYLQYPSKEGFEKVKECQNIFHENLLFSEIGDVVGIKSLSHNTRSALSQFTR